MTELEKFEFIKNALTKLFKDSVDTNNITPETSLVELGLDSLDIVELQMHYEDVTKKEMVTGDTPVVKINDLMMLM